MATFTPEQFEQHIDKKIRQLDVVKVVVFPVATATYDKFRQRLFGKGVNGNEQKTGRYSTKPMYASKSQFRNTGAFKPQGKTGKGKKKNGQPRKSMYLPMGYKQLRSTQGLETSFVDLQYTGDLFTDSSKLKVVKDTVVASVSRDINAKKIEGLTKRFGAATFKHTDAEREFFKTEAQKRLVKYFSS